VSRIETCGGHAEHRLGQVSGSELVVYGTPTLKETKTGRKIWRIPRPRAWPKKNKTEYVETLNDKQDPVISYREGEWREGVLFPQSPPPSTWRRWRTCKRIELPAEVECWGCSWIGIIKPEDVLAANKVDEAQLLR